jgi:DNA-binding GntR family transcriptional regulator
MPRAVDSLAQQIARELAGQIIRGELKAHERVREVRVAEQLNVSRGAVREALLILRRWHLVVIESNRGAHVSELTCDSVRGLYALMLELYVLLCSALALNWKHSEDLAPFRSILAQLQQGLQSGDSEVFIRGSVLSARTAYAFAGNPFLEQTLESLLPVVSRTHQLILDRQQGEMQYYFEIFSQLLDAVAARDCAQVRSLLQRYCAHNCEMVVSALERGKGRPACA